MGNTAHHAKLVKEKREAAIDEYNKGRYTVVGDLALKAVEQAIEAAAASLKCIFIQLQELLMLKESSGQKRVFQKPPQTWTQFRVPTATWDTMGSMEKEQKKR